MQACELEWLLNTLQETLASLKSGLEECVALLAPQEPGSTLALSSLRSESVKGFVTRVGTRIVKGVSFITFVFSLQILYISFVIAFDLIAFNFSIKSSQIKFLHAT